MRNANCVSVISDVNLLSLSWCQDKPKSELSKQIFSRSGVAKMKFLHLLHVASAALAAGNRTGGPEWLITKSLKCIYLTDRGAFHRRLIEKLEILKSEVIKSPRALLVSKTRDRGMCSDRPMGNQCCLGQDWNCQPPNSICSCDQHCREVGDCCPDYSDTCGSFSKLKLTTVHDLYKRQSYNPHLLELLELIMVPYNDSKDLLGYDTECPKWLHGRILCHHYVLEH